MKKILPSFVNRKLFYCIYKTNNYFQVVIFSNKSSTAYFAQMFLKENNIDCVGFSQREHYIERRKNLDQFLTGEVNTLSSV